MTELTSARLAELRAVAEAATPGAWSIAARDNEGGVRRAIVARPATVVAGFAALLHPDQRDAAHVTTFDPPTVLALIDALEAKTAEVEGYRRHFPCDGECNYPDGPDEECSLHGRNPRELWEVIGDLARERDEARARAERLTPKQPDGWSTQDRQEAKQEAERRWTDDWDGCQSDFDRGGINGFILGAEWQKARETFVSYKTIADRAETALERVRAAATEVADHWGDQIGTHYDGCWRKHAACLAALTLAETGADDA